MQIKKISLIYSIAISSLIFTNTLVYGDGGSDDGNYDSAEVVDADYMNGKEQAYNGKYKAAIVYLEKSIKNDSNNADAFNMLGYSNRKLGNNEEAFKYYNKALKLDPNSGPIQYHFFPYFSYQGHHLKFFPSNSFINFFFLSKI